MLCLPQNFKKIQNSEAVFLLVHAVRITISFRFLFSSSGPKGHVIFCHHLRSIVRLSKIISPLKSLILYQPLVEWTLDGSPLILCLPSKTVVITKNKKGVYMYIITI